MIIVIIIIVVIVISMIIMIMIMLMIIVIIINFITISYPYGGTVNFHICRDVQLTIHKPPMPNSSQTSAWSHRYIGRENDKTETPLLNSQRISEDCISETDGCPTENTKLKLVPYWIHNNFVKLEDLQF